MSETKQMGALLKQPVRLTAVHRGQKIFDQVFQHTPIRIGRLLDNDIVLPFDFVSRYHCEIRFENGEWTAYDLGSKNGLLVDSTTRAQEVKVQDGGMFRIQEVTLHLMLETSSILAKDFAAIKNNQTIAPSVSRSVNQNPTVFAGAPAATSASNASKASSATKAKAKAESGKSSGRKPMIDFNVHSGLLSAHTMVHQSRERAVQMIVLWHDQVIDAREVPVGSRVNWDFLGDSFDLGVVKAEKMQVKIPKGCSAVGADGPGSNVLTLDTPLAFRASQTLMVALRFVPRSKELAANLSWVEEKLVDPLLMSSAIHGAAAVTALLVAPKQKIHTVEEPERFATIIVAPTPAPLIALQPTPTPPPAATPTPTPPELAKKEPEKPKKVPEKVKVIVTNKKLRKVAVQRKEDVAVEHKLKPEVQEKTKEPPTEEPPVKMEAEQKPEPAPTPVFEAKKVGALKMLSMLNAGPASDVANVEKIQISRAPASVSASVVGREAINGTGSIESKLNQSAKGGGSGKGDGVAGIAVGGKGASSNYKMAGLAGKAGTRKIRGTVVGGATYSELSKNEGLTREQVMKVVSAHQSEIQQCYERSLMQNPDIVGRAEFEWEITAKGKVTFAKVKEATLRDGENLLDCVKGVFMKMQFPQAKNGESTTPTIGLPFGRL